MYVRGGKANAFRTIGKQNRELNAEMPRLPGPGECFKFLTSGGVSSIAFIVYVAMAEGIEKLTATTLRVGKKELMIMRELHEAGKLDAAQFIVGGIMSTDKGKKYDYYTDLIDACKKAGWRFTVAKNHSKIILMETKAKNKYVLETSSNLNENPKIEQFSLENDAGLYDFYIAEMERIGVM